MLRNGLCVLAFLLLMAAGAASDDYVVKIERPSKVGDECRKTIVTTWKRQEVTATAGQEGEQKRSENYRVELTGQFKVLTVDDRGRATKVSCVVEKCWKIVGNAILHIVEPEQTLIIEQGPEDTIYRVDGVELPAEAQKVLQNVMSLYRQGSAPDDDVFGSKERRKVGDSWKVNAAQCVQEMARSGLLMKKEDLKGTVKIASAIEEQGLPCLRIEAELKSDRFSVTNVPPNFQTITSRYHMMLADLFPVDTAQEPVAETSATLYHLTLKGPGADGNPVTVTIDGEYTREAHINPAPATRPAHK